MTHQADQAAALSPADTNADIVNILGEVLWHTTTSDTSIVQVSKEHMRAVMGYVKMHLASADNKPQGFLKRFFAEEKKKNPVRFLEVAAYAHITGYLLAQEQGWDVTLSDISVQTLALGAKHAQLNGIDPDTVRRVALDFHDLPFEDESFDVVYIASALHHTLRWQVVLQELQRVIAPGGLLILQNEPCRRNFCFYQFPTNRPSAFRPIEKELERLEILNTVGEPYIGSRPETLFGMIENQKMPLPEILQILESQGTVESLEINSAICMSKLDKSILAARRTSEQASAYIESELLSRLEKSRTALTEIDGALGYNLPDTANVKNMAQRVSLGLEKLPPSGSSQYDIQVADLFGGSVSAVMRKSGSAKTSTQPHELRYSSGVRNGVSIGFPPTLTKVLELAQDLVPDIQTAEPGAIASSFPPGEWTPDSNADLRYLVLSATTGHILLKDSPKEYSRFIVLLRIYGAPVISPFRIQLLVNGNEISGVDVYQEDSFLLRGEIAVTKDIELAVRVCDLKLGSLTKAPPVTVAAVRAVWIPDATQYP